MITRIELHNFMSHRETVIEPSPGLTVLVGPNNCGKSAVVAALQVLSQNRNSKLFTRHGEKLCSVVVHTSEGHVVEWRRKDSPSYRVNGQVFDRLGRSGIPDELQPLLRLPTVADEDDENFNVHFGNQKSPIFLLGSSAGTAAKFFASSSDAIRLVEMQQRHLQRVTEARRQRKQLEADAQVVNVELEALDATVPLAEQLADLEALHAQLGRLETAIAELERSTSNLVERIERVDLHVARMDALRALTTPPMLTDPEPLAHHVARIELLLSGSAKLTDETSILGVLPSPPTLEDVTGLIQLSEALAANSSRIQQLESTGHAMGRLHSPPVLVDSNSLEALRRSLSRAQMDVAASSSRSQRLAALSPVPELTDPDGLDALLESLERQTAELEHLRDTANVASSLASPPAILDESDLSLLVEKLAAVQAQCAEFQKSLDLLEDDLTATAVDMREAVLGQTCPTCGQPFDADQLLSMGAGGHAHA